MGSSAKNKNLTGLYYTKIIQSLKYLEYSYNRTLQMPLRPSQMSDAELEAWDSFTTRFARTSDIFLSKYIKAFISADDPAFEGGFVDLLKRAEKLGLLKMLPCGWKFVSFAMPQSMSTAIRI